MQSISQTIDPADKTKQSPTILVIEDNDNLRLLLAKQLMFFNLNPVAFPHGVQGLEWLKTNHADLVVLDWMLPDMEGIDVCREIRKQYASSVLPVLMLSALGREVDRRVRGIEAGANDFMSKPYEVTELVARIQSQLAVKNDAKRVEDMLTDYTARIFRHQVKVNPEALSRRDTHEAVIMFADLRGFTEVTAALQPENTAALLDRFFETMMSVVGKYNGCVLDLAGDELLVTFNIPDPVANPLEDAVLAAIEMHQEFAALQHEWAQSGMHIGLGIGIHHGEVVLGNLGGSELRRYTVIGNAVNIAHRFVEAAGEGEIILSPEVYKKVKWAVAGLSSERVAATLKGIDSMRHIYRVAANGNMTQAVPTSGGVFGVFRKLMK